MRYERLLLKNGLAIMLVFLTAGKVFGYAYYPPEEINEAGGNVPVEVNSLLPNVRAKNVDDIQAANVEQGEEMEPDFQLVFWQKTVDYRDGMSPAWLMGYQSWNTGKFSQYSIVIVDSAGNRIFKAPVSLTNEYCNFGFVIRIADGNYALVARKRGGKYTGSQIVVISVNAEPQLLFSYSPPALDPVNEGPVDLWNSTLYFLDIDGDGIVEELIDRTVTKTNGSEEHQFLLFKYNSSAKSFLDVTNEFSGQLLQFIANAKLNTALPRIEQYAPPHN